MKKIVAVLCLMILALPHAGSTENAPKTERKEVLAMTNEDAWALYEKYLQGWNSTSDDVRRKVAAEVTTDNIQYRTRNHDLGGRTEIVEDMVSFQTRFPGGHFEIGDVSTHHDVALLTWVLVQADGKVFAQGHDQIRVSAEGKISSIITFPPPTTTP
jgi:SnoaL-like domain